MRSCTRSTAWPMTTCRSNTSASPLARASIAAASARSKMSTSRVCRRSPTCVSHWRSSSVCEVIGSLRFRVVRAASCCMSVRAYAVGACPVRAWYSSAHWPTFSETWAARVDSAARSASEMPTSSRALPSGRIR